MTQGIGYGKTILFGEHFVVHGCPAIGAALSQKAIVSVEEGCETSFVTEIQGTVPRYTSRAIDLVKQAMHVKDHFTVTLTGDLPTVGGLGSSAAFCVALVRAFAAHYKKTLMLQETNELAYEGEKAFHGNPSGVDNTISTFGGVMEFKRGKTPKQNQFAPITLHDPLHLVIGMTGRSSPTKEMVEKVKLYKENNPERFSEIMDEAFDIVKRAKKSLGSHDLQAIGNLMNENQLLLREIGVSSPLNEKIIAAMNSAHALGAKVTGGGGGGCCIALAKDLAHAEDILKAVNAADFSGIRTRISSKI